MEIVQHIYQIKVPLAGLHGTSTATSPFKAWKEGRSPVAQKSTESLPVAPVNAYLIEGKNGNMLIDTGWNTPESYTALSSELKSYGFTIKDLTHITTTHMHPDHCGMAGKIKQFSNAHLSVSEIEAKLMHERYVEVDDLLAKMQQLLLSNGVPPSEALVLTQSSMPARSLVVVVQPDRLLKGGDTISFDPFEFTVIDTPGHSPGHISLYEAAHKWLFSGDHVLPDITPNISYHPQSGPDPIGAYLKSLEQVYDLEVSFTFPGHGPAFTGVRPVIESIIRHHEGRKVLIAKALESKTKTAYQISQEIPWMVDIKEQDYNLMGVLNRRFAVSETIAHLEHMVAEGEIGKSIENGIWMYFG